VFRIGFEITIVIVAKNYLLYFLLGIGESLLPLVFPLRKTRSLFLARIMNVDLLMRSFDGGPSAFGTPVVSLQFHQVNDSAIIIACSFGPSGDDR
jgi:hypothetical protein